MRTLKAWWHFYRKLFFPALVLAAFCSLLVLFAEGGPKFFNFLGLGYFLFSTLFHYFIYELRSSHEYSFYQNLGWSRFQLWASTVTVGALFVFICALL